MRTAQEIHARIKQVEGDDFFGFETSDYIHHLEYSEAAQYLKPGVTEDQWQPAQRDKASLIAEILDYMPFAFEKAIGERGLSAGRSIDHMKAWLWLAGEDDLLTQLDGIDGGPFGLEILKVICTHYGWDYQQWL